MGAVTSVPLGSGAAAGACAAGSGAAAGMATGATAGAVTAPGIGMGTATGCAALGALEFDRGAIGLLNAYAREAAVLHNIGYLGKSFGIHALAPRISTQRDGGVVPAKAQVGRKRPGKVGANRAIGRVVKSQAGSGVW